MNRYQIIIVVTAIVLASLAILVSPHNDDSGLIGGTVFYSRSSADSGSRQLPVDLWLLRWELACVMVSTLTGIIVFRGGSARIARYAYAVCIAAMAAFFISQIRSFNTILGPEYTVYSLVGASTVYFILTATPVAVAAIRALHRAQKR